MTKRIICILLTIIISINALGLFSVRAHAIAPLVAAFLEVVKDTMVGIGIGVTAQGGTKVICGISDSAKAVNTENFFQQSISDVTNDNLITASMDDNGYVIFSPSPNCSSESSVLANRLANELNSLDPFYRYVDSDGFNVNISAKAYAAIKNAVTNTYGKTLAEMASGDAVASAAGLTPYDFTFSGPVLPFQMPILTSGEVVGGNIGGYNLSSPEQLNANGNFNEKRSTAFGIGVISYSGNDNDGYELWCVIPSGVCYNWGMYIVYNGKIYYCPGYSSGVNDRVLDKQTFRTSNITSSYTSFYDVDGNKLNKNGLSPTSYVCGIYYVVDPTKPGRPRTEITVSDISGTEAGTSTALTLAPQRTSAEETVGEGMAIGVIPQDATLTLDDSGNIVKVDGIDLSSIESLLNQLKNGQLDFDSLEAYLSTIQTLLANGNATRSDIDAIIRNIQRTIESSNNQTALINAINSALQAQTNAITDALSPAGEADEDNTIPETLTGIDEKIGNLTDVFSSEGELLSYLESIDSNTKTIADSMTSIKDIDIEKEDIEFDVFNAEHTGLVESNEFVSRWELVNQCKQLLNNVINEGAYLNQAPSFKFYWDSNKDGKQETYTALDLSFLETRLTNNNLADKDRFQKSMTVREFIQLLMIFLCYISFAVKMLRKLPGLVTGGESAMDSGLEIKNIERAEALKNYHSLR